jgi:sialic acid synthase SpsE/spore coat polysaccharide biosynthesis protein SpsF (cytidylyltransferase family)
MKIIAESAFNHNGNLEYLLKLAGAAKNSGADYFTVQVMNVDAFCTENYVKYDLYKETEFSEEQWKHVFDYCESINMALIPCVLDEKSFNLAYNYGFKLMKLHATDITNEPFLNYITTKKDVQFLLETQCATVFEINFAIETLGKHRIEAIFTGYSNYPSEVEELNLNVIDSLKKTFSLKTGFADHSLDTQIIPLMVLAKGADYLEKHITLSRNDRHFDWQVSLYPYEFASMVNAVKHYSMALGNGIKHPTTIEKTYRDIIYKKVIPNELTLKRANEGFTFIENRINSFRKDNIIVALIARLKSQRLKKKVLLPFCKNELIVDLYNRVSTAKGVKSVILATSDLEEDKPLADRFEQLNLSVYKGDAISVIDRMLSLAFQQQASAIFRVTGDNPFTDPKIMEIMINLMKEYDLDYVKVNNVPFGIGAELFSTQYLWKLYLKLKNTAVSEYLTWFVLQDNDVRMGCVYIESDKPLKSINLSVDYEEDYERCKNILSKIHKERFSDITLQDIVKNIPDEEFETVDLNKSIKLPEGKSIKLLDYLEQFNNRNYVIRYKYKIS